MINRITERIGFSLNLVNPVNPVYLNSQTNSLRYRVCTMF
jgi:hypothetical protein